MEREREKDRAISLGMIAVSISTHWWHTILSLVPVSSPSDCCTKSIALYIIDEIVCCCFFFFSKTNRQKFQKFLFVFRNTNKNSKKALNVYTSVEAGKGTEEKGGEGRRAARLMEVIDWETTSTTVCCTLASAEEKPHYLISGSRVESRPTVSTRE